MPQQVAPLKIKSSQKNACVKSLEMYAITPVTYHVTFIFFISHVSNDIKTELAIRLPPCLGNSLLKGLELYGEFH